MHNKDFATRYELDLSRGVAQADSPDAHVRPMQAIEALHAMHAG